MRIRRVNLPALAVALLVMGMSTSVTWPVRADDAKVDGTWKLVVLAFGDDEFALIKLSPQDGKTSRHAGRRPANTAGKTAGQKTGTERR